LKKNNVYDKIVYRIDSMSGGSDVMFNFLKKKKKKVYDKWFLLIFATVVIFLGIGNELYKGTSAVELSVDEQRDALLETAHAYFRQGVQNQYDSYRKNLYSTPEDATSQHYTYTVCSGFVYQVYYQTFGIDLPSYTEQMLDYAKQNKDNKELVLIYYEGVDNIYNEDVLGTAEISNYSNLSKEWAKWLLPGDVIIVTGHAFMVDSIDYDNGVVYIIESGTGGRYNDEKHYDNYDENGTIQYRPLSIKLGEYYKYLGGDNEIERMAVIRFINEESIYTNIDGVEENYNVTDAALSRVKYPDIDIEKIVKVIDGDNEINQNVMVDLGNTLTYEITIKNNSGYDGNSYIENKKEKVHYGSFDVVENFDSRLEIVNTGGGTLSGNQIKWDISELSADESITISYTVKVPNDILLLGEMIVSTGMVDNIATSRIESLIGNKLTSEEKNKLLNSFEKIKNNSSIERDFINDLYFNAFELNLGLSNDLSNLDIISYDSSVITGGKDELSVKTTRINDVPISKYIYSNYYGLRIGVKDEPSENVVRSTLQWNIWPEYELRDRARTLTGDTLNDGDIILVYVGENSTDDENLVNKSYIYLNGKLIRKKSSTEFEEISGEELVVFLRNIIGDNYVVLRPSIKMIEQDKELIFNSNIIVDESNNYIKYNYYDSTSKDLLSNITIPAGVRIFISDVNGDEKTEDDLVVTGDVLTVYLGSEKQAEYKIAVRGDTNGDGKISLTDLVQLRKHIVDWKNPKTGLLENKTGIYLHAIDMNNDGNISLTDLVRVRKVLVGIDIDE